MAKLTAKQEKFCTEYITCGNASEAYRRAYDCGKMLPQTINSKGWLLLQKDQIRARIDALQKKAADAAVVTLEGHLNDLRALRDAAASAEQYSAAISAEISRGKAAGLYTEKQQVDLRTLIVDFGAGDDG